MASSVAANITACVTHSLVACVPHHRIELCRDSGRLLRAFPLTDCDVQDTETRGVHRSALLKVR